MENRGEVGFRVNAYSKRVQNSDGKYDVSGRPAQPPIICPECNSSNSWKAGIRYTKTGEIQRFLCRDCDYRFSESSHINKNLDAYTISRRVCVSDKEMENLAKVETRLENALRESTKGQIISFAWQLKKKGLAPSTIKQRVLRLNQLVKHGSKLMDPDSVTTILALSDWTESNKQVYITTYKSFVKIFNLTWEPPKTRVQRKLPFIPTENELDQLIAACGPKTATFLQVLKDTAARGCEASKLQWTDVDVKTNTIRINNPVKGSLSRIIKVPSRTIAMINALPKTSDYIFNPNIFTIRKGFQKQRKRIVRTLQNPRLKQIHFHTLRHWKATMEYHKTKDILHVKRLLGHKKIENTEIYTHLINFESDEWNVATASTLVGETKLLEAGFQYVRYSEKDELAIYRKRK